jgi:HEAT repeat protein
MMSAKRRLVAGVLFGVVTVLALSGRTVTNVHAQGTAPAVDELVQWLDRRETEWVATAYLQQMPGVAIPRLLRPGRAVQGHDDRWTPTLLTLAKIGEPAIPAIVARLDEIRRRADRTEASETYGLIKVLGAIGPPAVPALVQLTEATPGLMFHSLGAVQRMEPRRPTSDYGQILDPWIFWRAADDGLPQLERAVVPMLPRIQAILDNDAPERKARGGNWHFPAAYLLARWGTGDARARGRQVFEDTARSSVAFYDAIGAIRELHGLRDPATAGLIRLTAPRVPDSNDLRPSYLLSMAIVLQQLGEKDYGPLVDEAIKTGLPHVRVEAAQFLGATEDLFNVPRLVALLGDGTEWNGQRVAAIALQSLRQLTFQDLPPDSNAWQTWMAEQTKLERGALLERWLAAKRRTIATAPIWEANAWIAQLKSITDGRVLPLIADYLRRKDLDPHKTGPDQFSGQGSGGPKGMYGPAVVTVLLRLAQHGVPGAVNGLEQCLQAADSDVRTYAALALAMYQRPAAVEALARELVRPGEDPVFSKAAEFLLDLGDRRGLPSRLTAFDRDAKFYINNNTGRATRRFACRDLRIYTQQPLPCHGDAPADVRAVQAAAWRNWLNTQGATFQIPQRAALLDLEAYPLISPIAIGQRILTRITASADRRGQVRNTSCTRTASGSYHGSPSQQRRLARFV